MNGSDQHLLCVHSGNCDSDIAVCFWTTRLNNFEEKKDYEIIHNDSIVYERNQKVLITCETNHSANEIGTYIITEEFEESEILQALIVSWLESIKNKNMKIHCQFAISWDGHGRDNRHLRKEFKLFFLDIVESMLYHLLKWCNSRCLRFKSMYDNGIMDGIKFEEKKNDDHSEEDKNDLKLNGNIIDTAKFEDKQNDDDSEEDENGLKLNGNFRVCSAVVLKKHECTIREYEVCILTFW